MFMLESHLTTAQNRVVAEVQAAAAEANMNLFVTAGAVRDMLGGYPIRDLDFTVEGNSVKLARSVAHRVGASILEVDDTRKTVELLFPGGITAEIAMARQERYTKPGGKPQVTPATIHEDLRGRDFTVNALALSLNRASRGLLIDPTNGLSDLGRRELRATTNYSFYDRPIRLFRLLRLKVRLGFAVAERTQMQYENARQAGVERSITPAALRREIRALAAEPHAAEILQALEAEKLLPLISPALTGPKLNLHAFQKLQKARQLLPFGMEMQADEHALFLYLLTEKLTPKERTALLQTAGADKELAGSVHKLESRARKLEKELSSSALQRPSHIYQVLSKAPTEQILLLLIRSGFRVVQDRIKTYYGKYLPAALEITDLQVMEAGAEPGSPKFNKKKAEIIAKRLDSRPKRPPAEIAAPLAESQGSRRASSLV
jgi:tRNA nucleotidyltransferase/poly(A) polymerase